MKRLFITALLAGSLFSASAQQGLDLISRAQLHNMKLAQKNMDNDQYYTRYRN